MAAPKRNSFASKPPDERHDAALYVRMREQDKRRIVEAAGDLGVAAWARAVLLDALKQEPSEKGGPSAGPNAG